MSLINTIVLDHEDFFKIKLLQASFLIKANSNAWVTIRSNLSSKYKFTVDLDTFSEALGAEPIVLPTRSAIWQKGSSVLDLYIRYDFKHEQDAAVREMLVFGLTERNRIEFNPSLTIPYLYHRFASMTSSSNLLGLMRLKVDGMTKEQIEHIINTWDTIHKLPQTGLSYDSYHSFLEKL